MTGSREGTALGAVDLHDVQKCFVDRKGGDLVALEDITMSVASGEFAAIIGPSGCGKSTLLRIVAGLDSPTAGSVTIDGEDPARARGKQRIGMAFQDHALLPWLSIQDSVALPFTISGRQVDSERVDDLIRTVGLEAFADARPRQLSGGMKQRVVIARALALNPDILLLDEPFGALDAITRRRLNVELERIWLEQRVTTLLVTHAVDEAVFLADTVYVMTSRPGRLLLRQHVELVRPRTSSILTEERFLKLVGHLTASLDEGYLDD